MVVDMGEGLGFGGGGDGSQWEGLSGNNGGGGEGGRRGGVEDVGSGPWGVGVMDVSKGHGIRGHGRDWPILHLH